MLGNWELIKQETSLEGFDIRLYIAPEDSEIGWDMTKEEKQEIIEKINNGSLLYFIARVVASKNGIELGLDVLGGCCYSSIEDFLNDGYYKNMVDIAIIEAKLKLKTLYEGL